MAPACWAPAPQWTPKPPRLAPRLAREVTEAHKGTASWGGGGSAPPLTPQLQTEAGSTNPALWEGHQPSRGTET